MRTGRFRFVEDWRGRQLLEVEIRTRDRYGCAYLTWIPAAPSDAADLMQRAGAVRP